MTFITLKAKNGTTIFLETRQKLLYILMYTVQYKFFFGFFQFFSRLLAAIATTWQTLSGRAVFMWEVDDDEMEDEG